LRVVLAGTGPIVAYLNARDRHHPWAVGVFKGLRPPMLTCEAVLSEAVYLLRSSTGGGERVMDLATGVLLASSTYGEVGAVTASSSVSLAADGLADAVLSA
jgi:hypothetical protein